MIILLKFKMILAPGLRLMRRTAAAKFGWSSGANTATAKPWPMSANRTVNILVLRGLEIEHMHNFDETWASPFQLNVGRPTNRPTTPPSNHYVYSDCQRVQNAAARLVLNLGLRDHVTPAMKQLPWLPVEHRIKYKLCRPVVILQGS